MENLISSVFPECTVIDHYICETFIVIRVASRHSGNHCPTCGHFAQRVHSLYDRTVQDMPISGRQVILRIRARKFFCDNPDCSQRIFTERFEGLVTRSQQKTSRLNQMLTHIAFELGGNPGAILAHHLGVIVSHDTMLARIREHSTSDPPGLAVHVIGIDDWAFRRGSRYGTLICDMEHHQVLDVLPDRRADTVANWLKKYPDIQIVSRDRASAYADAVRTGLPHAQQVADRWHLLKNLGDAVQHYLARQPLPMREIKDEGASDEDQACSRSMKSLSSESSEQRRKAKWQRVQEVQQLHQSGVGKREISRRTGLSRKTIRAYLTWTDVPSIVRSGRSTVLDPYREKIVELVGQSLKGPAILCQIREQGYQGSRTTLSHYLAEVRRANKSGQSPRVPRRHRMSPRRAAILLTTKSDQIDDRDKHYLEQLLQEVKGAKELQALCASFYVLMRTKDSSKLSAWIEAALRSSMEELNSFVAGIRQDMEAVLAGIKGPWSNGQLEGQVNRLKMIKRQMYGRASFTLLRARVLHHA